MPYMNGPVMLKKLVYYYLALFKVLCLNFLGNTEANSRAMRWSCRLQKHHTFITILVITELNNVY